MEITTDGHKGKCSGWQHCLYRMETDRSCTGERADCKN